MTDDSERVSRPLQIEPDWSNDHEFPPITLEQWKAAAAAELKRDSIDSLATLTLDAIHIKPLYTEADWPTSGDGSGFPGFLPFIRGRDPLGHVADCWNIHPEHASPEPGVANRAALEDLENGASSIQLRFDSAGSAGLDPDGEPASLLCGRDGVMIFTLGDLDETLKGVRLEAAGISIDAGAAFLPAAALMIALVQERNIAPDSIRVAFNADPLGTLASDGSLGVSLDAACEQMGDLAAWTARNWRHSTAVEIGSAPYHHAGASSVQDLAFAVATGVEYLRALDRAGLDAAESARMMVFGTSIGCQFFRAIARLRALRAMWAKVLLEAGAYESAARATALRARTSRRVLTTRDPWVNLLRNTVCAFAAAVAEADSITTVPLDSAIGPGTSASRRLARNIQLILREECQIGRVLDPAGGSWFIERLTQEFAEKAWDLLRAIEARGGMSEALVSGWVADQIREIETARARDVAMRRQVVTGVSAHVDPLEPRPTAPGHDFERLRTRAIERLESWKQTHDCQRSLAELARVADQANRRPGELTEAAVQAARAGATIGQMTACLRSQRAIASPARAPALPLRPYAAAYEELRDAVDSHAVATGAHPRAFLAAIGSAAELAPRIAFVRDILESGGIQVIADELFPNIDAAALAFVESHARIAVICANDAAYENLVKALAPRLRAAGAHTILLAGNPGTRESRLRADGIDRFLFARCDVLSILRELLQSEGVFA